YGANFAILVVAAVCLLCVFLAQPLHHSHDSDRMSSSPLRIGHLFRPLFMVLAKRNLRKLVSTSFVFSGVQLCLAGYLVTYLHTELGYSLISAGIALSAAQMGGIFGRILWGYVADRFLGATWTLIALSLAMAFGAVATGFLEAEVPWLLLLALVIAFGASATGWNGVYLAAVARRAPAGMAGAVTGGALSVAGLVVVIVPEAFGFVSGIAGSFSGAYIWLALPILACGLLLWTDRGQTA